MENSDKLRMVDRGLEDALYKLADSQLTQSLILQGGGALHFIYSSPRYSNDIDFVDKTIPNVGIDEYMGKIRAIGSDYKINKVKKMSSGKGLRAKWGQVDGEKLTKVEIESRATDNSYTRSKGKYRLLVKSLGDIYTDKIFANLARFTQRRSNNHGFPIKPTDFFDLKYLENTLEVNRSSREQIINRGNDYGLSHIINNKNLDEIINLITDEDKQDFYRECFRKSILPEVFSNLRFDKKYFQSVAEHFENYKI